MEDVKISSRAYTKMIFHAAKYPHCAVNGILLAKKSSSSKKPLMIMDAIPLFHQCLYVSPMAEIALIQIEAMAADEGFIIAGYYAAPENFYDCSIEKAPSGKIAEKIAENFSNACFVIIDNKYVCLTPKRAAVKVWQNSDNKWTKATFDLENSYETLEAVSELLQRGAMKDISDFDNHLDNPENDWTNKDLNKDIEKLMSMYVTYENDIISM